MKPQTKPNDIASKLRAAKALIATPETWCQGTWGRTACDAPATRGRNAARFCSWGALVQLLGISGYGAALGYLNKAALEMGHTGATNLNDLTDHPTVLRMFDRAIALAEQEAAQ